MNRICYPATDVPEYLISTVTAPQGGLMAGEVVIIDLADNTIQGNITQNFIEIPTDDLLKNEELAIVISGGTFERLSDGRMPKGQPDYTKYMYRSGETTPVLILKPWISFYLSNDCLIEEPGIGDYLFGSADSIDLIVSETLPNNVYTIAQVKGKHHFRMGGNCGEEFAESNICMVLAHGAFTQEETQPIETYLMEEADLETPYVLGNTNYLRSDIEEVTFLTSAEVPYGAIDSWDISDDQDGSIMAWLSYPEYTMDKYVLNIGSNGEIFAPVNCSHLFSHYTNCVRFNNLIKLRTDNVTDMTEMFSFCLNVAELNVGHFNTSNVEIMDRMFANCNSLVSVNVENFDVSKVYDFEAMFLNCTNLEHLNLAHFVTTSAIMMDYMFTDCKHLKNLDVSSFDTSNLNSIYAIFGGCESLEELNVANFNTNAIVDFENVFMNCTKLKTIDISAWDFSSVSDCSNMFSNCSLLETIIMPDGIIENVGDMTEMFSGCSSLKNLEEIINHINFETVLFTSKMFKDCSLLQHVDLASQSVVHILDSSYMFENCINLTDITIGEVATNNISGMFKGCSALVTINAPISVPKLVFTDDNSDSLMNVLEGCTNLINFNGFVDLGTDISLADNITNTSILTFNLIGVEKLSGDSLATIFANIGEVTPQQVGTLTIIPKIRVSFQSFLKLTPAQQNSARDKGWTYTS